MSVSDGSSGKAFGTLAGLGIGNALGILADGKTRAEILEATHGKGVQGFKSAALLRGEDSVITSDTKNASTLAIAVCESLVRRRGFDLLDCMMQHSHAYEHTSYGWEKVTIDCARETQAWLENRHEGRDPRHKNHAVSIGTDVAMKAVPLGIFDGLCQRTANWEIVHELGNATHADVRASLGAYAIATLVSDMIRSRSRKGRTTVDEFINWVHTAVKYREESFQKEARLSEDRAITDTSDDRLFSRRLRLLAEIKRDEDLHEAFFLKSPAALLKLIDPKTATVMDVIPLAIGIFMRHPDAFDDAVLEAVNLGFHPSVVASLVGALVGANIGFKEMKTGGRTNSDLCEEHPCWLKMRDPATGLIDMVERL